MRWYPKTSPLAVEGGIRSQRAGFGSAWWSKAWLDALERLADGSRLGRGRTYARRGQALEIEISAGVIAARVQGSRQRPYAQRIELKVIGAAGWDGILERLVGEPLQSARLLVGELDEGIEALFESAGQALFPAPRERVAMDCSCPDYAVPCKHLAAVFYLVSEAIEQDPLALFELRGMPRDRLLAELQRPEQSGGSVAAEPVAPVRQPLPVEPAEFWGAGAPPDEVIGEAQAPGRGGSLLSQLGPLPFWRGEVRLLDVLDEQLVRVSAEAVERFLAAGEGADGAEE